MHVDDTKICGSHCHPGLWNLRSFGFPRGKRDGIQTVVTFKRGFLFHTHFLGQEERGEEAQKETKWRTMPRSHQTGRQEHMEAERTGEAVPRTTDTNGGRQTPPTTQPLPAPPPVPPRRHGGGEEGPRALTHLRPLPVCAHRLHVQVDGFYSATWVRAGTGQLRLAGPELTDPPGPPGGPVSAGPGPHAHHKRWVSASRQREAGTSGKASPLEMTEGPMVRQETGGWPCPHESLCCLGTADAWLGRVEHTTTPTQPRPCCGRQAAPLRHPKEHDQREPQTSCNELE